MQLKTTDIYKKMRLEDSMDGWGLLDSMVGGILQYFKGPIVEIGMGASTEILAKHAKANKVKLYSCDVLMGGRWSAFEEKLFDDHILFVGYSENFIKQFDDKPAIVFIDGDHTYDVSKMEFDFFFDKLMPGGIIFLHDTFSRNEPGKFYDVYRLRQELECNPDIDVFTWPYSATGCGLTMIMKHEKNENRSYWRKNGRA